MTPAESFKLGFLMRCAEEGLLPAQIEQRIYKAAGLGDIVSGVTGATSAAADALKTVTPWALGLPLVGGAAFGALGGAVLSKANDDSVDPREARNAELIAEYRRAVQDLTRRRRMSVAA